MNLSKKTIHTYMGTLKPSLGNANYCSAGQLSPLLNDPYYRTLGLGTRIFLGGAQGFITWHGSQHKPEAARLPNGTPRGPAGTLMLMGELKEMNPRWIIGASIQGYGCSLALGVGIPIPILDEEMAMFTSVSDADIVTQVKDYSFTRPEPLCEVTYAELRSGSITVEGRQVPTVPLSSYVRAQEIANILKEWIQKGEFQIGEPQKFFHTVPRGRADTRRDGKGREQNEAPEGGSTSRASCLHRLGGKVRKARTVSGGL